MIVDPKNLGVLAQSSDLNGTRLRGAARVSRRRRSQRWWARKCLEQSLSTCIRFRYVLLFLVVSFIVISFKNQVMLPENTSASWSPPASVIEPAGSSAATRGSAGPYTAAVTSSETAAVAAPVGEQVVIDTESLTDQVQNAIDPLLSAPVTVEKNADS